MPLRARKIEDLPGDCANGADIATWQSRMRAVVLATVTAAEVEDVLRAVLERAKRGDLQAARMILQYAVTRVASRSDPRPPTEHPMQIVSFLAYIAFVLAIFGVLFLAARRAARDSVPASVPADEDPPSSFVPRYSRRSDN